MTAPDDGSLFDPVNLPAAFAHDGLRVTILGETWNDGSNIHPWGSQIEILDVRQRPPAIPVAPTSLQAVVGTQSVDLTWTENSSNETAFRVAISTDGGATWNNVGVVAGNVTRLSVAAKLGASFAGSGSQTARRPVAAERGPGGGEPLEWVEGQERCD